MSDSQKKAAEALRQAAEALFKVTSGGPADQHVNTPSPSIKSSIRDNVRRIFSPYPVSKSSTPQSQRNSIRKEPLQYWSHRFCLLQSCSQETVPSKEEKKTLYNAGLGEKKISFIKHDDALAFRDKLLNIYPKLKNGGGFELLRTDIGSRTALVVMKTPSGGFSSKYLSDDSDLNQAMCFIRPMQIDLDLDEIENESEIIVDGLKEECINCGEEIPVEYLKKHLLSCKDDDNLPKVKRKCVRQTTVCQFANKPTTSKTDELIASQSDSRLAVPTTQACPLCNVYFSSDFIELHSSTCCEMATEKFDKEILPKAVVDLEDLNKSDMVGSKDVVKTCECIVEEMEYLRSTRNKDNNWNISVVRSQFVCTAMDQLVESNEEDWLKPIRVKFIGEDGVDSGGLTREFFSLLFNQSSVFEDSCLSLKPNLLEDKHYYYLGKSVAVAILEGHPGPRKFNRFLTDYIIADKIPQFSGVKKEELKRADALTALEDIEICTEETIKSVFDTHMDTLSVTGFNKSLTMLNKDEALTAIKAHFLLYRMMPSIVQFKQGLELYGVLNILKKYPNEARGYIAEDTFQSADMIQNFYLPSFSSDELEKSDEEMVIYNFCKFLKRVENSKISTPWINPDTLEEQIITLNTGHILQALLGSPRIPSNISCGLMTFDHVSNGLTTINTCAPSISFSNLKLIQTYSRFEETLLLVVVGAHGFGIV